jgi:hypothetical protein
MIITGPPQLAQLDSLSFMNIQNISQLEPLEKDRHKCLSKNIFKLIIKSPK